MTEPPLVAVAHGSRDPRSAATIRALTEQARTLAPGLEVRTAFLDLSEPNVTGVLADLHACGHRHVVTVPLLLGTAYHARVDLPALTDEVARDRPGLLVTTGDVLGLDPTLEAVARQRLCEAGADPGNPELGVVLAAVGSSHPPANDAVRALARRWRRDPAVAANVAPAFATATTPDVPAAAARLRARGARRLAVAPWFLAAGLLLDRVGELATQADPAVRIAAPLGADRRVAEVLLRRYAAARHAEEGDCARVSA